MLVRVFYFVSILLFPTLLRAQISQQKVEVAPYRIDCLIAPEGFETKEDFPGYLHLGTKSSILVTLVKDKNLVDAESALNEDYFNREHVKLISKSEVLTVNKEKGLLYKFAFSVNGEDWERYSLFLGDLNSVLWVNASYLVKYKSVVEEELLKSLKTTKFKVK
jgi:hypothetical protein